MSKNNEKWDRSGFNELIREDKQKAYDFKKGNQIRNTKDPRYSERLHNIGYNDTQKKYFTNSTNIQSTVKVNNNESFQEVNKFEQNNKTYNTNYFNFKPKRRKNNPTETSLEKKVTDKTSEEVQTNLPSNDNNTSVRNNMNLVNNSNNLKRNNFYKGNNRNYDGRKKTFNRNKNFYQKAFLDNDLYKQQKNFVPHEGIANPSFIRNPQFFNPPKNSIFPNFPQYGFEPVLYNNAFIQDEFQPMQSPFIENAIKNEVNNEITFNKKPFKKYVEELVKSNDKKNNFKLNLNSTYFPNNSKAAFPGEEQNDQPGINMEKIPFNYNEKIGLSMYPMNNEYSNMIFSNFPPFFAFNPMYNHQNLNIYMPNKSLNEPSNYILPHQDQSQNYYYHNSINNYYNYLNSTQAAEIEREKSVKNNETQNSTFTTVTTKADLVNSFSETKELIEDEKETGKDEKNKSLNLSIIEEEKTDVNNDRKKNIFYNNVHGDEISSLKEEIILVVNIKVMQDSNSTLIIKRNDDIFNVTKSFCQSNNLSESLSRAIYIKVLSGITTMQEIKENELSENMLGLIKRAYSIYKDNNVSLDDIVVNEQSVNNEEQNYV